MRAPRRSRVLAAALSVWLGACAGAERVAAPPAPEQRTLTVLTYNVNYGLHGDESGVSAIRDAKADVVLLQETTPSWEAALEAQLLDVYPTRRYLRAPAAGGMAVLSRFELVDDETIPPPERGWFAAWRFTVRTELGLVQFLNVHLRPQISDSGSVVSGVLTTRSVRRAEIGKYFARLEPELPTLIAGDFNEGSGGGAIAFLEKRGYKSARGELGGESATWRWTTSVGTVRAELDHIVYGPGLEPLSVNVVAAGRSDHLPVIGRFVLTKGSATPL